MADRDTLINDPETAFRTALDGRQAQTWTSFPAIVTKVDFSTMTLECQPTIQGVQTNPDGTEVMVNLPVLVDCPIQFPSGGGFIITFPIAPGDEVLVHIANRCIDAWFQLGGIQPPLESRMHDLSDGFAVPGIHSLPNLVSGISSSNLQIRTKAGSAYIEMTPSGQINLVGNVNVTGTLTATGEIMSGIIPLTQHIHVSNSPGSNTGPALP